MADSLKLSRRRNELVLGNHIKDYEVKQLLGKGGFGFVYQAKSLHNGQNVAIKMIDKKLMQSANMTQRIVNEIEIHSQLKHESVLQLYAFFEDTNYVYVVLELCERGDLYHYLAQRGSLTEPEARELVRQLILGLQYLHSFGIIHRDLKLSNLLLTHELRLKISDFGLAAQLTSKDDERETICGTPNYIAPEVAARRPHNSSADLWSLGCLLYTLLTGRPPFESEHVEKTFDKAARLDYSFPESMSATARDLIALLLQADPKARPTLGVVLKHQFFVPPGAHLAADGDQLPDPAPAHAPQPSPSPDAHRPPSEALAPLSTARLSPFLHTLRNGNTVSITEDGEVCLGFPIKPQASPTSSSAHRTSTERGPRAEMYISRNGRQIRLEHTPAEESPSEVDGAHGSPSSTGTAHWVRRHAFHDMPPALITKYRFALKFVDVVRAKTPKITFFSALAKCQYMENGPRPALDLQWYDNTTLARFDQRKGRVTILRATSGSTSVPEPSPSTSTSTSTSSASHTPISAAAAGSRRKYVIDANAPRVPAVLLPVLTHLRECLHRCIAIERDAEARGVTFPIIVSEGSETPGRGQPHLAATGTPSMALHSPSGSDAAGRQADVNMTGQSLRSSWNTSRFSTGTLNNLSGLSSLAPMSQLQQPQGSSSRLDSSHGERQPAAHAHANALRPEGPGSGPRDVRASPLVTTASSASTGAGSRAFGPGQGPTERSSESVPGRDIWSDEDCDRSLEQLQPHYLQDVGWALRTHSGVMHVLHIDGSVSTLSMPPPAAATTEGEHDGEDEAEARPVRLGYRQVAGHGSEWFDVAGHPSADGTPMPDAIRRRWQVLHAVLGFGEDPDSDTPEAEGAEMDTGAGSSDVSIAGPASDRHADSEAGPTGGADATLMASDDAGTLSQSQSPQSGPG